jgi:hypothetical protein
MLVWCTVQMLAGQSARRALAATTRIGHTSVVRPSVIVVSSPTVTPLQPLQRRSFADDDEGKGIVSFIAIVVRCSLLLRCVNDMNENGKNRCHSIPSST